MIELDGARVGKTVGSDISVDRVGNCVTKMNDSDVLERVVVFSSSVAVALLFWKTVVSMKAEEPLLADALAKDVCSMEMSDVIVAFGSADAGSGTM